jgi:hypothetical protein
MTTAITAWTATTTVNACRIPLLSERLMSSEPSEATPRAGALLHSDEHAAADAGQASGHVGEDDPEEAGATRDGG